ncbi:MAG TPA: hypothetical protein VGI10_08000 [Polyangiaceae bacterium]|jgi:hypothetical protein
MTTDYVLSPRARWIFAASNAFVGALFIVLCFVVIKTRFWLVDLPLVVVVLLLEASALGLFARRSWAERVLRVAAWAAFACGLALSALLVLTIAFLRGVYGEMSGVAMATCGLVVALVIPYLIVLPALELSWLGPRRDSAS